ncbi:MAG: hypothetical protein KGK08_00235 [Acidobacteriota bacterium]|nr:hypothetical protein [Acidobacteriota bacterium]
MKRLLTLVTLLLATMALVMPLLECFDRWDPPGLASDSEFPLFLIVLFVALVLLTVAVIARRVMEQMGQRVAVRCSPQPVWLLPEARAHLGISRALSLPLRT